MNHTYTYQSATGLYTVAIALTPYMNIIETFGSYTEAKAYIDGQGGAA